MGHCGGNYVAYVIQYDDRGQWSGGWVIIIVMARYISPTTLNNAVRSMKYYDVKNKLFSITEPLSRESICHRWIPLMWGL